MHVKVHSSATRVHSLLIHPAGHEDIGIKGIGVWNGASGLEWKRRSSCEEEASQQ